MTDDEQADEVAVGLVKLYQSMDVASFVVRTTGDEVRLIGVQLPPKTVAKWLRRLADEYERVISPVTLN